MYDELLYLEILLGEYTDDIDLLREVQRHILANTFPSTTTPDEVIDVTGNTLLMARNAELMNRGEHPPFNPIGYHMYGFREYCRLSIQHGINVEEITRVKGLVCFLILRDGPFPTDIEDWKAALFVCDRFHSPPTSFADEIIIQGGQFFN